MGTCVGRTKLSRCADFERATLTLSGRDQFIFTEWAAQPAALSKEWYAQMGRLSAHYLEIAKRLNPADPIEFFHLQVIQGKPVPPSRCIEIGDAFENLREGFKRLDEAEIAQWNLDRPECQGLAYHLNAYIDELRACANDNRAFAYAV